MPSGECKGCGYITNSAMSNWWLTDETLDPEKKDAATKCYVRVGKDGKWEKGCADWDKLNAMMYQQLIGTDA